MLELKKLTVENFGIFTTQRSFEFHKGLNILQGRNGHGKSTIIQAIELLLIDSYEGAYENYINTDKEGFSLSLDFEVDGTPYSTRLEVERGKDVLHSSRQVYKDGSLVGEGEDAKAFLNELFDFSTAKYALISKQGDRDNIISVKDSERIELIKKIKNYSFEKGVANSIEPRIKDCQERMAFLEKEIYSLKNTEYNYQAIKDFPCTEEAFLSYKGIVQSLAQAKTFYDLMVENKRILSEKVVSKKAALAEVSTQLSLLEASISKVWNDLQTLRAAGIEVEKENLLASIKALQDKHTSDKAVLEQQYMILSQKLAVQKAQVTEKLKAIEDEMAGIIIDRFPPFNNTKLKEKEQLRWTLEAGIATAKARLELISSGHCPTCGAECVHTVDDVQKEILQDQGDLAVCLQELAVLEQESTDYTEKVKKNDQRKERRQQLTTNQGVLERDFAQITQKIQKLDTERATKVSTLAHNLELGIAQIQGQITLLQQEHDSKISLKEQSKNNLEERKVIALKQFEGIQKEIKGLEGELQAIVVPEWTDETEAEYSTATAMIAEYEKINILNVGIIKNNKEQDLKKELNLRILDGKERDTIDLQKQIFNLEKARTIMLKDFPLFLIDQSIASIQNSMNAFINQVYTKDLNIALKSTKTTLKLLYGKKQNLPAYRLSGAEKRLVQVSFITHFNELLNLKCIFLDEVDAAMDDELRTVLYEAIVGMRNIYKQIILTSHSDKMKQYLVANAEVNIINI